jgi:hypothetical protein
MLGTRSNCGFDFLVDFPNDWVFRRDAVLHRRLSACVTTLIAAGLIASAPAGAQELIDVAALEAQVEAAAELTELPAEPDWGVPDLSNPLPAVSQDAPEVPPAPTGIGDAAPETRYQTRGAQYHTEYHTSEVDPAPPPATEPASPQIDDEPAQAPATPEPADVSVESAQTPAVPEASSSPTIWIWIWNWSWVHGSNERYHNSQVLDPSSRIAADENLKRVIDKIGSQIPVQIDVQTGDDIADEIMKEVAPEVASIPTLPVAAPAPAAIPAAYRAPAQLKKTTPPLRTKPARGSASLERPYVRALDVTKLPNGARASTDAAPAPRHARPSGKAPRPRRASRPAPTLPLPSERLTDATTASGVSAGIFLKSFAVLIASMLLAALGGGRRLQLPSIRLRGLFGTRTDPPG